ncbi:MAG: hypothetical protein ACQEP1_04890 [Nanobdellota archaeon]
MRDKYFTIVHEKYLDLYKRSFPEEHKRVKEKIDKVRRMEQEYDKVRVFNVRDKSRIPLDKKNDPDVIVMGALRGYCCLDHLYTLRKEGFNACLYENGCMDTSVRRPAFRDYSDFEKLVPEYKDK